MNLRTIRIKNIAEDDEIYPRSTYDWVTAYKYSENLKQGAKFPPICVNEMGKDKYLLIDGKHRLEANKTCKNEYAVVEVIRLKDKKEMFLEAVRRNLHHGLKLSTDSLRQIVVKLEDFGYNKNEIAKLVMIPATKLNKFVGDRLINTTTGRTIVAPQIQHIVGEPKYQNMSGAQIEDFQDKFTSGSTQEQLLREILLLVKSDTIDRKNAKTIALWKTLRIELYKMKL